MFTPDQVVAKVSMGASQTLIRCAEIKKPDAHDLVSLRIEVSGKRVVKKSSAKGGGLEYTVRRDQ